MARNAVNGPEQLITRSNPRSPVAEAYRQLRTNIQFSSPDRRLKTLLITSTHPEEGKSTILANLATTFAQTGSRVILVDCDLRRPSLHRIFGVRNSAGLTSVVLDAGAKEFPYQDSGVPNLRLLCSGPLPPNPSELLGSRRMAEIIEQLTSDADYVLFDSPPVVVVTDAAILASKVDGVMLVVYAGRTRRELAKRAKALLDKVNANLLGVILNNVKYDASLHKYYAEQ